MWHIVPSCNPVQYQGKLMMKTWENDEKPNFGPNFGPQKSFSWVFPLLVVRNCSKLSSYAIYKKSNKPNLRKWWKTFFPFGPNLGPQFFFRGFYLDQMLETVACYNCMQFQEKRLIQTQENGEKPHFGSDLDPLGSNSNHQIFFLQKFGFVSH